MRGRGQIRVLAAGLAASLMLTPAAAAAAALGLDASELPPVDVRVALPGTGTIGATIAVPPIAPSVAALPDSPAPVPTVELPPPPTLPKLPDPGAPIPQAPVPQAPGSDAPAPSGPAAEPASPSGGSTSSASPPSGAGAGTPERPGSAATSVSSSRSQSGDGRRAARGGTQARLGEGAVSARHRRLVRTVTRFEGCLPQVGHDQRRVLVLRAGLGSAPALTRAQVARRLALGVPAVTRIERRGLHRLGVLAREGACEAGAGLGAASAYPGSLAASDDPAAPMGQALGTRAVSPRGGVEGVAAHADGHDGGLLAPATEEPVLTVTFLLLAAALAVLALAVRQELRRR